VIRDTQGRAGVRVKGGRVKSAPQKTGTRRPAELAKVLLNSPEAASSAPSEADREDRTRDSAVPIVRPCRIPYSGKEARPTPSPPTSMPIHPFVEQKLPELWELCRRYHVAHLELLGSAATGSFDPAHSDVDLLMEMERSPADGSSISDNYFDFLRAAESLFGRKVDLVPPLSQIENRYFREEIEQTTIPLYDAATSQPASGRET
jgi:uncharacterized protein